MSIVSCTASADVSQSSSLLPARELNQAVVRAVLGSPVSSPIPVMDMNGRAMLRKLSGWNPDEKPAYIGPCTPLARNAITRVSRSVYLGPVGVHCCQAPAFASTTPDPAECPATM